MTIFHTSDTHLFHTNVVKYDARPATSIEEHDEMIIRRWNDVVMPWDTVVHHGDVALGQWPVGIQKVHRLNGYKVLIPGNHDRISSVEKEARREKYRADYTAVFQEVWSEVVEYTLGNYEVILSHYPYEDDHTSEPRYMDIRAKDEGLPIIHGHTHSTEKISYSKNGSLQVHVGVTAWDYRPVSEGEIHGLLDKYTPVVYTGPC